MSAVYAKASGVRRDVIELVRAPDRLPLSQTIGSLLYVEQSGAMVPYDGTLTPYMREPMDCLKSRRYDSMIYMGPARTGKTVSVVDGWMMDIAARNPADTLLVQISQDKAAEFSKKRLERSMMASEEVRAAMSPRASDNNIHDIKLKNGTFFKIGWPSKTIFASSDWCNVLLTDYDRMPLDIGGEGSGFLLAGKRTQTFMSRGMVMAESSPGRPVSDPGYRVANAHEAPPAPGIASLYNMGDRRLLMWQCPDCDEWFEGDFDLLHYDKDETDPSRASADVFMVCPHCGAVHREGNRVEGQPFKHWANNRGIWLPDGCQLEASGRMTGEARPTRSASFWQKGPSAAFQTWEQLVYKLVAAKKDYDTTGDVTALQTTVNVDQGKPFVPPRASDRDSDSLSARQEDLGVKVVPPWVRFLIASVDVQGGKDRHWAVQVQGFGADLQSVIIDRFKIEKSKRENEEKPGAFVRVHPGAYLEDWDLLIEKVIAKTYPIDDGSGRVMPILRAACDSNGEDGVTNNAYAFYRRLKRDGLHRRFCLVKGASAKTAPLIEKRYPDNTGRKDRKAKAMGDVPVYFINTDRMKDIASASLNRDTPGPRFVRFPQWLPQSFFDELMAEERSVTGHWEKITARNESFDLLAYAWTMIHQLKAEKIHDWCNNVPLWAETIDNNPEVIAVSTEGDGPAPKPARRRRRSS